MMDDPRYVRWNRDELLDHAIDQAAQQHGFTVTYTRRAR
jgi:hypothetical protein